MNMTVSEIDKSRRTLLTIMLGAIGGIGAVATAVPFIKAMSPSERTKLLGSSVAVDLKRLNPGEQLTMKWRGKPVWILRRTPQMLTNLEKLESRLRDPFSEVVSQQPPYAQNLSRSIKPEYFVCVGLCTHLGCVPKYRPDVAPSDLGANWLGGYFCPCHGSQFDLAGRVYQGVPAPTNLVIPSHHYAGINEIIIGID
jgi:ubiquinol-cytochrome c reductase iron-sulfur subunit